MKSSEKLWGTGRASLRRGGSRQLFLNRPLP